MAKPIPDLLAFSAILFCLTGPAAAQGPEPETSCKKRLSVAGFPHRLKTIAQINAIRSWTNGSKKHGGDYAVWHYAMGGSIECEKLQKSDYYRCTAAARPCLPPRLTTAQAKK